jgi:hypothetical protein
VVKRFSVFGVIPTSDFCLLLSDFLFKEPPMKHLCNLFSIAAISILLAGIAFGQACGSTPGTIRGGLIFAGDYNYGGGPSTIVPGPLFVATNGGNNAVGLQAITVRAFACISTIGGDIFMPFATNAPITIDSGSNAETVTPTSVSCSTPTVDGTCTIVANFANLHGAGARIASGTGGLQEALNRAMLSGGGVVTVDQQWAKSVGANASTILFSTIQMGGLATGLGPNGGFSPTVYIRDQRGPLPQFFFPRPGPVLISAPSAPTLALSATGGMNTGTYFVGQVCLDPFGQPTLQSSANSSVTATSANPGITVTPSACGAGAVGWVPTSTVAGGSDGNEVMLTPAQYSCATSAGTLELAWPQACALGTAATIIGTPASTQAINPEFATARTTAPVFQGSALPWAPFLTVNTQGTSAGNVNAAANADICTLWIPAPIMNYGNKGFRIKFIENGTGASTSTVPVFNVNATNNLKNGAINTLATFTFGAITAAAWHFEGQLDVFTTATGASGAGQAHGFAVAQLVAGGGTPQIVTDSNSTTSSIASLLTTSNYGGLWIAINAAPTGAALNSNSCQVLDVEPLNE